MRILSITLILLEPSVPVGLYRVPNNRLLSAATPAQTLTLLQYAHMQVALSTAVPIIKVTPHRVRRPHLHWFGIGFKSWRWLSIPLNLKPLEFGVWAVV
jgi:hypothetical protein